MSKNKHRKIRGKIRQQIRWVIEDQDLWDDDLLIADELNFKPEPKDKIEQPSRSHQKTKLRQPTHRDVDLWIDD